MDEHNNGEGSSVAMQCPPVDCEEGCKERLKDGDLQVNSPGGYKYPTVGF